MVSPIAPWPLSPDPGRFICAGVPSADGCTVDDPAMGWPIRIGRFSGLSR